jgi:hypothetical protein
MEKLLAKRKKKEIIKLKSCSFFIDTHTHFIRKINWHDEASWRGGWRKYVMNEKSLML